MKKNLTKQLHDYAFLLGFTILAFVFCVVFITSLIFLVGGSISLVSFMLPFLATIFVTYNLARRKKLTSPWLLVGLFIVLLSLSVLYSGQSIDASSDGNMYHKSAIGAMKEGWNPVWETREEFNNQTGSQTQVLQTKMQWENVYPKATWFYAANVYRITGNIETGKSLVFLVWASTILFAFALFRKKLGNKLSIFLAVLLSSHPVFLSQFNSFYLDSILGNLVIILLVLLTLFITNDDSRFKNSFEKFENWFLLLGIFFTIVILINTKFTGLAYAALICFVYYCYLLASFRSNRKKVLNFSLVGVIAVIVGVCIVGLSSYVKNTYLHGHPLWPLYGKNSVNFIPENSPASFNNKNRFEKFLDANFSKTSNIISSESNAELEQKLPFMVYVDELYLFQSTDIRIGGYGPLFGGILLVSTIIGLALLRYYREARTFILIIALPVVTLFLSIVFFEESWWARYFPHLYIFPILVLGILLVRKLYVLAGLLGLLIAINAAFIITMQTSYQSNYKYRITEAHKIDFCSKPIYFPIYYAYIYNVIDACNSTPKLLSHQEATVQHKPEDFTWIYMDTFVLNSY